MNTEPVVLIDVVGAVEVFVAVVQEPVVGAVTTALRSTPEVRITAGVVEIIIIGVVPSGFSIKSVFITIWFYISRFIPPIYRFQITSY